MSQAQQLEEPPPYSQDKTFQLPSVPSKEPGDSPSKPTVEAALGNSSNANVSYVPGPNGLSPGKQPEILAKGGTIVQHIDLPSAPTHTPGRTQVDSTSRFKNQSLPDIARSASASIEDPNDRMAAEALCGLGKSGKIFPNIRVTHRLTLPQASPESNRSDAGYKTPLQYFPIGIEHPNSTSSSMDPEPLLSLLTSSHPWLGGTVNGSISAYSSTKSHTPRIVQFGAGIMENTVSSVSRATGVEGSIRRYLDSRQPNETLQVDPSLLEQEARGRSSGDQPMDIERVLPGAQSARRTESGHSSIESLPPYDENKSPAYEELRAAQQQDQSDSRAPVPRSWPAQLIISTSGLGAALSEGSLRSLKFCLKVLGDANRHIRYLMDALRQLLLDAKGGSDTEKSKNLEQGSSDPMDIDEASPANRHPNAIAERIKHLNHEIWQTFKTVVNTVSRYTGGALPENASMVVRWQLMSVPQRWHRAQSRSSSGQNGSGAESSNEAVNSANKMLAFALEGLEMMDQVSGVVDSTIKSAEKWLDSLGGKKQDGQMNQESSETSETTKAQREEERA